MARIETDPNYTSPTFSRATAATDAFKKEDVQLVAAALSTHVHDGVHGLALVAGSIPNGTITSAMIADATIDTVDLKDGSVTSAKILDGTIATVDLANAAVTNAKLASDTARANLLTNGGFEIWQRGTGPFAAGSGTYHADRWQEFISSGTISVARDTANTDNSAACAAVTTTGTGTFIYQNLIANGEALQLRGKVISFSARVKCNVVNACRLLVADVTGGVNTYSAYHPGNNTYQTLSVTLAAPVAANSTNMQVQVVFDAAGTYYVDNCMAVVGSQTADYAPLHPADDLARCLRYYEAAGAAATDSIMLAWAISTAIAQGPYRFKVRKAVTPTMTSAGTWQVQYGAGFTATGALSPSGPTIDGVGAVQINGVVAAPLTVGQALAIQAVTTASQLIAEANP